jgi:hypothetical protein
VLSTPAKRRSQPLGRIVGKQEVIWFVPVCPSLGNFRREPGEGAQRSEDGRRVNLLIEFFSWKFINLEPDPQGQAELQEFSRQRGEPGTRNIVAIFRPWWLRFFDARKSSAPHPKGAGRSGLREQRQPEIPRRESHRKYPAPRKGHLWHQLKVWHQRFPINVHGDRGSCESPGSASL